MSMRRLAYGPLSFIVLSSFLACGVAYDETVPTGPPQQIPVTNPIDGGAPSGTIEANVIELCSVEIIFDYTDRMVVFKNKNDQKALVHVYRPDDTVLAWNALWNFGEDAQKDVDFAIGDEVRIVVEFLDLNLSFEQWKECANKRYILGL